MIVNICIISNNYNELKPKQNNRLCVQSLSPLCHSALLLSKTIKTLASKSTSVFYIVAVGDAIVCTHSWLCKHQLDVLHCTFK